MMRDIIVRAVETSRQRANMPHRESIERTLQDLNARSLVQPGSDRGVILPPRIVRRVAGAAFETSVTMLVRRPDMPGRDDNWLLTDTATQVRDALDDLVTPGAVVGENASNWGSVRASFHDPVVNGPLSFWLGPTATASVTRTRDAVALTSLEYPENPDGPDDPARQERTLIGEFGTHLKDADPMPYLIIAAVVAVPVAVAWGLSSVRGILGDRALGARGLAVRGTPRANPHRARRR